jgi:hypothetical protein
MSGNGQMLESRKDKCEASQHDPARLSRFKLASRLSSHIAYSAGRAFHYAIVSPKGQAHDSHLPSSREGLAFGELEIAIGSEESATCSLKLYNAIHTIGNLTTHW